MVEGAARAVSHPGLRRGGKLVRVAVPAYGTLRDPVHGTVRDTSVTGDDPGTRQGLAEARRPRTAGRTVPVHGPVRPRSDHGTRPHASVDESTEMPRGRARTGIVRDPGTGR
ncbi:hypothetical protein ACFRDV_33545 [Streptomyces fagopyri]|uniref:hypothetical protein n=1 Tax=Streptomyces fagopyri TaxID=2662397 RepID=UPI0036C28070